jgi:maleylacetate reductase
MLGCLKLMDEFNYKALPWNIVFGTGSLSRLAEELDKLGFKRAVVLTTPNQRALGEKICGLLGDRSVGLFDRAKMHGPAATLEAAQGQIQLAKADCTVSVGGGSTTGLGKALVMKSGISNIAIPTTYAGSEMTDIWAVTEAGRKVTNRDYRVVPSLTIYDAELTLSLPSKFAVVSGLNAMAQAVVNVATDYPNPIVSSLALDAVRALVKALPIIKQDSKNIEARSLALYGACMAGAALGTGSTGIHHRLCHTFGGIFNTPHAETHAILLPYSISYNARAAAKGTKRIAEVLGVEDAAMGMYQLARELDSPQALSQIGILESDLDRAAEVVIEKTIVNPESVTRNGVRALLQRAFEGSPPKSN